MNETIEKMLWVVLAVGIYALSAWAPMAKVEGLLQPLAGTVFGAAILPSVAERRAKKRRESLFPPASKKPPRRPPPPPPVAAFVLLALLPALCALPACATTSPAREACYADAHFALASAAKTQCPPPVPGAGWTGCEHRERLLAEHRAAQARCP